ncbi:molybdopterin molybdotransferase MoeA [Sphingomonas lutea]|uniref:Molybdopterin molybdenumtransferase n=1 Tax=Sphingomonas lutea TaxID=1045317 RepID=A0A7G9SGA3_9SPHN|nr:molybdopterin molybdotransferase MoeA [Sphingomonas lutea]QNN66878.1 molybdopterin molybdotransferase MoeA [Sphingomonas lutea]
MISFDEALAHVRAVAQPLGKEVVAVSEAAGRVLAAPVIARISSPRSDVSAMDGYAVREADLAALPAQLGVVGESFAGSSWDGTVGSGQCARVFTGAPVPAGADRVVIQEDVRREDDVAIVERHPGNARHIRKQGGDFEQGDEVLPAGRLLDKRAIVAAAAADAAIVEVFTRPRVHILSTGDELAEPGTAAETPDAIPESVSLGVAALAAEWGAEVVGRTRLRDDLRAMEVAAAQAIVDADLVVVTGGASVGEKDFAKTMFEPAALDVIFAKVSIKPGKPVWLGRAGNALVMGLPGNPTSALVTGRLLLAPLLAGLAGQEVADALHWRSARLGSPLDACGARETFHRAQWIGDSVELLRFQDSGAQKALAEADVLIRQSAHSSALPLGSEVTILDF